MTTETFLLGMLVLTCIAGSIALVKFEGRLATMRSRKDAAYLERNRVVAALARVAVQLGYRVGLARTNIAGWNEHWHNCVYIDLPTGQVSWHYHDDHRHLFAGLPAYEGTWDGHSTPEKYDRLGRYAQVPWLTSADGKVEPVRCGDVLDAKADYIDLIDHDRIPGIGSAEDLAREADTDGARQMEQDAAREGELLAEAGFTPETPAGPATCAGCGAIAALKDGRCRSCRGQSA